MAADPSTIRLLALDVDGVLTDGSILINDAGQETKRFNIRDGFGLRLWARLGFHTVIITGRSGPALQHRAAELNISDIVQGCTDKGAALESLAARTGLNLREMAFLGDDWPDICALTRVGYPMAVADAAPEVLSVAAYITRRPGGRGAVREAVEHLITAHGLMDRARALYD
jgi:3-deoxy-D-manno-octulosonate 8-phosphate phosphatase (KDO 8-P phosphatase)